MNITDSAIPKEIKTFPCYCNSRNNSNNKILHKNRCCMPCKLKFINSHRNSEREINSIKFTNEPERIEDSEMKIKSERKGKDTKPPKLNDPESKKNMGQGSSKKKFDSSEHWNSSPKVFPSEKPRSEEAFQKMKTLRTIKEERKTPKPKQVHPEFKNNRKEKPEKRKVTDATNFKNSNNKENSIKSQEDSNDDNETIYISYSLKGFIKIKSRNEVEILDRYYIQPEMMCDDCRCGCIEEGSNNDEDSITIYCKDCNDGDSEYCLRSYRSESCSCPEEYISLGHS